MSTIALDSIKTMELAKIDNGTPRHIFYIDVKVVLEDEKAYDLAIAETLRFAGPVTQAKKQEAQKKMQKHFDIALSEKIFFFKGDKYNLSKTAQPPILIVD